MLQFLKNIPFVFFVTKRIIFFYKKLIYSIIFNKHVRRYYDRKISQIDMVFLYLADKKNFLKKNSYPSFNGQEIRKKIVNKIFIKKKI